MTTKALSLLGVVEIGRLMYKLEEDSATSPTDGKRVLEEIRKIFVGTANSYQDAVQQCLHTETIVSVNDPKYEIFEKQVAALLEGHTRDEQILILTLMIMSFK